MISKESARRGGARREERRKAATAAKNLFILNPRLKGLGNVDSSMAEGPKAASAAGEAGRAGPTS
jgi:hypothetical protein